MYTTLRLFHGTSQILPLPFYWYLEIQHMSVKLLLHFLRDLKSVSFQRQISRTTVCSSLMDNFGHNLKLLSFPLSKECASKSSRTFDASITYCIFKIWIRLWENVCLILLLDYKLIDFHICNTHGNKHNCRCCTNGSTKTDKQEMVETPHMIDNTTQL